MVNEGAINLYFLAVKEKDPSFVFYDAALFLIYQADKIIQETEILLKARIAYHIPLG